MTGHHRYIVIDAADNVATAITGLCAGEAMATESAAVALVCEIAFGHKFALEDMAQGEYVARMRRADRSSHRIHCPGRSR